MGSSNSSTLKSAEWESCKQCYCGQSHYIVDKVRWISVPMPAEELVIAGRLIVGIASFWTTERLLYKWHQYSHDVVEVQVTCRNCRKSMCITLEFSKSGKQSTFGRYTRVKEGRIWKEKYPTNLTFFAAKQIYESTQGGEYDIGDNNCKHFAERLYNRF